MKRVAIERGILPRKFPVYALSETFVDMVRRYGRNFETGLLLRYYLKTNPLKLFGLLPMGIQLLKKGRVSLRPSKIKNIAAINKILAASKQLEIPREKEVLEYREDMVGYRAVG